MKKILKAGLLLLMPLSLLFTACSSKEGAEEESDYAYGITNEAQLTQSDALSSMSYVESRVDLEAFTIRSTSEEEADERAIQEFNSRLTSINDAEFDAMFKGSDYYSLILKGAAAEGEENPELARKIWPTDRQ